MNFGIIFLCSNVDLIKPFLLSLLEKCSEALVTSLTILSTLWVWVVNSGNPDIGLSMNLQRSLDEILWVRTGSSASDQSIKSVRFFAEKFKVGLVLTLIFFLFFFLLCSFGVCFSSACFFSDLWFYLQQILYLLLFHYKLMFVECSLNEPNSSFSEQILSHFLEFQS